MSTLPVAFVPFTKKLLSGASFSVTVPIMMLITANVPEQRKTQPCRETVTRKATSEDEFIHVLSVLLNHCCLYTHTLSLTYGDVSRSTKDKVNQHRVEGGVKAEHWR